MLNIISGRECLDKEKYIYDQIKASDNESLVLVPNQYTLVAEEQAIKYLGTECLFNTEILSMNRLGYRILAESGRESVKMISKYGRFMLLTKIVNEHRSDLTLFSKSAGKLGFSKMLDDFIISFKQQNCTIEDIEALVSDEESNSLLKKKLSEIKGIINDYEKAIEGKYIDSEDYISMYVDAIPDSKLVEGKDIWIYGYDSITPKFTRAMLSLSQKAKSVNLVVNESDYELDRRVISMIRAKASEAGVECEGKSIDDSYRIERAESIARIEQSMFKTFCSKEEVEQNKDFIPEGVELVQCANQYYEAENAAAYIHHLIRDEDYSLRDITVICNSEDKFQPVVKRALSEYGIPVFLDSNRLITDSVGVCFIVNLLKAIAFDYSTDSILALLKTGLTDVSKDDIEDLENYARDYHIRNTMWTRDFKYGDSDEMKDQLAKLNELRADIIAPIMKLRDAANNAKSTSDFVDALLLVLEGDYDLKKRNEDFAETQESAGLFDESQRTRVSLDEAYDLLDQVKEILGDDYPLDRKEFLDIYATGLTSIEVGVLPPSLDDLALGTLIRTRPRPNRAVLIIGANEGTLPLQPSSEGLFSVDEKDYFRERNFPLGDIDDLKMIEENVAIYRMFSHPSERLYVSYSMTSITGDDLIPSPVVDSLVSFYPKLESKVDIVSRGWGTQLVSDREEALRHLVNHIKDRNTSSKGDVLTRALLAWYRANTPDVLDVMLEAAQDENEQTKLGEALTKGLYARDNGVYVLSASKVDKFNNCPFSYYVAYGLSPKEERSFNSDPRSIGDLYHECLKEIASEMMNRQLAGEASMTDDELMQKVSEKLSMLADNYKGGLFLSTGAEQFHLDRIREICFGAAKAVSVQLSTGAVKEMHLEEGFGNRSGYKFKPVEIEVGGEKVYIEGRIDRADIMDGDLVRIIDYKTGNDTVNVKTMSQGYKMQLMIYLMSAIQDGYEPAGIFYFNIKDPETGLDSLTADKAEAAMNDNIEDHFKLNGRVIDDESIKAMMPPKALGSIGGNKKFTYDDYKELRDAVKAKLDEIGQELVSGEIKASPLRVGKNQIACTFCEYKAICRHDNANAGNKSRKI